MSDMATRLLVIAALIFVGGCGRGREPGGTRLYVTNEMSGDLTIIDPGGRRAIGRVALGKRPRGIVPSPDGRLLYIALSGSPVAGPGVDESTLPPADKGADGIAVFDVAAGRVLRVLRGVSDPETVAVSPDGSSLYVASEDRGELVVMDARSGRIRAAVPVGGEAEGTAVSPDGSLVYATSEEDHKVAVYEVGRGRVRARIDVGERPRNAVFSPDGRRAFVPGENDASVTAIDVAADRPAGRARIEGENVRPMGIAISGDGRLLFVTTGRGRELVRLDPRTALGTRAEPGRPLRLHRQRAVERCDHGRCSKPARGRAVRGRRAALGDGGRANRLIWIRPWFQARNLPLPSPFRGGSAGRTERRC
jgi:YVTN family beta-propeller protein